MHVEFGIKTNGFAKDKINPYAGHQEPLLSVAKRRKRAGLEVKTS